MLPLRTQKPWAGHTCQAWVTAVNSVKARVVKAVPADCQLLSLGGLRTLWVPSQAALLFCDAASLQPSPSRQSL